MLKLGQVFRTVQLAALIGRRVRRAPFADEAKAAIDGRTTRHAGYGLSQQRRKAIECIFGWGKQHGTMRKTKHRSAARVGAGFLLNLIAYNLIRIPKLVAA